MCSAAETVLPLGVFITITPRRVAAGTSMLSTPTPARTTQRSLPGFSSRSAVMRVPERTMAASAARRAETRSAPLEAGPIIEFDACGSKNIEAGGLQLIADQHTRHGGPRHRTNSKSRKGLLYGRC